MTDAEHVRQQMATLVDLFITHPVYLPVPLNDGVRDPLAFAETIGGLIDYSLDRRTGLVLHRLIQAVIRQSGPRRPTDADLLSVVLAFLAWSHR
jgi:hypothetical protein